jgi:septum formation protein
MTIYHLPSVQFILASASMARQKMLQAAGLDFIAMPAAIDEDELKNAARSEDMSAMDTATMLAEMKAKKIAMLKPEAFVLASDQLLVCEGNWFSKPLSEIEAAATLRQLSGRRHQLVTAAVIYQGEMRIWHQIETPEVAIRNLTEADISAYIKAMASDIYLTPGVYQIEGLGAQIISAITGSPYAALGLPLLPLLAFLRGHGLCLKQDKINP